MHLSTKGRYAVMAMIDLAELASDKPVKLADIAERQDLSLSYLEQLFAKLRRAELVKSIRGPGGGYALNHNTDSTYLGDIIAAVEESIDLTRCGGACDTDQPLKGNGCVKGEKCNAHNIWVGLSNHMMDYLAGISVGMILRGEYSVAPLAVGMPQKVEIHV